VFQKEGSASRCFSRSKNWNPPFRLSEPNVRIEADGELAWSDETLKKGGLRFTNLSAETRQQIRHRINQPAMLRTADHGYAPSLPSSRESPAVGARRPNAKTVRSSATAEVLSLKMKIARVLRGFSGGLATGLLIFGSLRCCLVALRLSGLANRLSSTGDRGRANRYRGLKLHRINPGVFASAPPTANFSSNRIETSKEAGIELRAWSRPVEPLFLAVLFSLHGGPHDFSPAGSCLPGACYAAI
jgi:hypothetical protein